MRLRSSVAYWSDVVEKKKEAEEDQVESIAPGAAGMEVQDVEEGSPAPALRDDPRVVGDWELIGTTSSDLAEREGLTGLGRAPFTKPLALFTTGRPPPAPRGPVPRAGSASASPLPVRISTRRARK